VPAIVSLLPDRQYPAPAAADGVVVQLPGGSWSDSPYGELIAEADADSILTGIVVRPPGLIFDSWPWEVDIAVGPEGEEGDSPPIATFRGHTQEVFANFGSDGLYLPTIIGVDAIPNGSRVSACWRSSSTSSSYQMAISATYLKKPLAGTFLSTPNPLLCYPSRAANLSSTNLVSDAPWADGAPVQIFGASGPAKAVVAVMTHVDFVNQEWELDLFIGGSETPATTIRSARAGVSSHPNRTALEHPLFVPASTSLSFVARLSDPPSLPLTITAQVAVNYFELPL
jgi:hypothetical protein